MALNGAAHAAYGGRYLTRGGTVEEFGPLIALRQRSARASLFAVEGV
jgi:uncharacterized protein (DUF1330 family)